MSHSETTDRIVRKLRGADKPAMSAADLADELGVSVKTINNNIEELIGRGEIETTQIGNAKAYYIPDSDLPSHKKPDHTCHRCGREANDIDDVAKIDLDIYFDDGGLEPETTDFYVLCRFCYSDLVSWLYGDDGSMRDYQRVHSWNIPESQLQQARNNPEIQTRPEEPSDFLDNYPAYELFESLVKDREEPVDETEFKEKLREELGSRQAPQAFQWLENGGYFSRDRARGELLPAK